MTSGSPTGRALNQPCSGAPTQRCCTVTAFGEFFVKIFCISTRTTSSTTSLGSVALGKGKLDSESFEHMTSALLSVHRVPPGNCWTKCSEIRTINDAIIASWQTGEFIPAVQPPKSTKVLTNQNLHIYASARLVECHLLPLGGASAAAWWCPVTDTSPACLQWLPCWQQ